MSLNIITGPAGSGKTEKIFKELIESSYNNPNKKHYVITPEQNTLLVEKRLIKMHKNHVLFNVDVISFNRLAVRLFEEADLNVPNIISETGKSMLLRKCVMEHEKDLKLYNKSADKSGFINKLKVLLSEFNTYGISVEDLENVINKADSDSLKCKFSDLSIIFDAFYKSLDEKQITSEMLLSKAFQLLGESHFFDNSFVVFDGFIGFTPFQYNFISEILKKTKDVFVSLSFTGNENELFKQPEEHELFAPVKRTAINLQKAASDVGFKTEVSVNSENIVKKPKELIHITNEFLQDERKMTLDENSHIKLYSCINSSSQIELVINKINELVKTGDYFYRDFAVVSDNLEDSFYLIKNAFNKADIPCFIDTKIDESSNPLVTFTLSALEVIEKNFSFDSVFRFLKTGFSNITDYEIDVLENYVLATGVRGLKKWSEDFTKDSYLNHEHLNMELINDCRKKAIEPLIKFHDNYMKSKKAVDIVNALLILYRDTNIEYKLEQFINDFESSDEKVKAIEYRQIFDGINKVLSEFSVIFGEIKFSAKRFSEVLKAGVSDLKISAIPPSLDEVHIGDVRRSRRGFVKVLFFIDFNDGIVPAASGSGGILSDRDRDFFTNLFPEKNLAPTSKQSSFDEQFDLYEILSAPTDYLFISCAKLSIANNEIHPSIYFSKIIKLFENLSIHNFETIDSSEIITDREALSYFARNINKIDLDLAKKLYVELAKRFGDEKPNSILDAAFYSYENVNLSKETIDELYGDVLHGYVSRLEKQASCAFSHFLAYGLKLNERTEFGISGIEKGNYFHKAFENIFSDVVSRGISLNDIDENTVDELIDKSIVEAFDEIKSFDLTEEPEGDFIAAYWKKILKSSIIDSFELFKVIDYNPVYFEKRFNDKENSELNIKLDNDRSMRISGIIDRVDELIKDENLYLGVVDYKTYNNKLDDTYIANGIQLQLFTYLKALLDLYADKNAIPGSVSYYHIGDGYQDENDESKEISKKISYSGKFNCEISTNKTTTEDFNKYIKTTFDNVIKLGNDILNGDISINPYEHGDARPCTYCKFKNVCRFDKRLPGMTYRSM